MSLSGCEEYSMPKPEMITFTTDIMKMTTNITSFNIIAAVWSFCLLIFRLPMATNRIPTNSCQDWNGNRLGKQRSSTKNISTYTIYSRSVAIHNTIVKYLIRCGSVDIVQQIALRRRQTTIKCRYKEIYHSCEKRKPSAHVIDHIRRLMELWLMQSAIP